MEATKEQTDAHGPELSAAEREEAEDRKHPRAQVLYEAVRLEGQHELERPISALAWSGLAAGMSMGFSMVAMGLLRSALPEAPWKKLVVNLGYSVGFLIIIVARQQLFTENSLTPVIPLLDKKDFSTLLKVLRLWAIVLVSNLVGTLVFALAVQRSEVFTPEVKQAFGGLAEQVMEGGFASHFARAIFAGWLIALMMWMLAGADARAFLVVVITYIIGVGELSHVIAGSVEALYAVFDHRVSAAEYVTRFLVPVGLGNMVGGIGLVALLNHAQVAADGRRSR